MQEVIFLHELPRNLRLLPRLASPALANLTSGAAQPAALVALATGAARAATFAALPPHAAAPTVVAAVPAGAARRTSCSAVGASVLPQPARGDGASHLRGGRPDQARRAHH